MGTNYSSDGIDILLCVSVPSVFYIGRLKVNAEAQRSRGRRENNYLFSTTALIPFFGRSDNTGNTSTL